MKTTQESISAQKKEELCHKLSTGGKRVSHHSKCSSKDQILIWQWGSKTSWSAPAPAHTMTTSWGPALHACSGLGLSWCCILGAPQGNMWDEPQLDETSGATYFECIIIPCKSRWASKIKSTICLSMAFFPIIILLAPEKTSLCSHESDGLI